MEKLKKDNEKLKEVKEYIGKFYNNKFFIAMLIVATPFLFILVLKFIYAYVPGEEIGDKGDWISFAGGYLGVIGAVCIVWYQMKKEEKDEIRGLLYYIKDILECNKNNYTLEYMEKINSQALSLKSYRENTTFKVTLKDLDLNKVDKLLLYKHRYINFIKLDDKIKKTINSYDFVTQEKNIVEKIKKYIEKKKEENKGDSILFELEIIFNITLKISAIYSYSNSRKKIKKEKDSFEEIDKEISKLNRKEIRDFISSLISFEKLSFYDKIIFSICENEKNLKEKYLFCLRFLYEGVVLYQDNYEEDYGAIIKNILEKKRYLFSEDYENLISKIEKEYKELEEKLEKQ